MHFIRLLLPQPLQIGLDESTVICEKIDNENDKDMNEDILMDKEDKGNTHLSSNSISPQSTVTQLTVTQLTGN